MNDTWYSCEIRGDSGIRSDGILFSKCVVWNKESKTLTDIAIKSDKTSYNEFGRYDGNDLRVRLNSLQITLSGWRIADITEDDGFFKTQITYSEYKEGWLTEKVFFEVQNLTEWVYSEMWEDYWVKVSKDFSNRSEDVSEWLKDKTDNKKSWFASLGAGLFCVKLRNASPKKFDFKYLNENFALTLYDEHTESRYSPFLLFL